MKTKWFFEFCFLCIVLLLCGCQDNSDTIYQPEAISETIVATPTQAPEIVDPLVISPENIHQLQVVDRWGMGTVFGVLLSPDEKTLALITTTGVYLYDSTTLQQYDYINSPIMPYQNNGYDVGLPAAFSPDGSHLAIGYKDVQIWNLAENQIDNWLDNRIDGFEVNEVQYSLDGKTMGIISMGGYAPCDAWGGNIAIYDLEKNTLLYDEYFCPVLTQFSLTFTENNTAITVVFNGYSDHRVSIIDQKDGSLITRYKQNNSIKSVNISGKTITTYNGEKHRIEIIDAYTQATLQIVEPNEILFEDTWKRTYRYFDDQWNIFDPDGNLICDFTSNLSYSISPNLITETSLYNWNSATNTIEAWDLSTCSLEIATSTPILDYKISYLENQNALDISDPDFAVLQDNIANNRYSPFTIKGDEINDKFIIMSVSDDLILSMSADTPTIFHLWDKNSGILIKKIQTDLKKPLFFALNPNGDTFLVRAEKGIYQGSIKDETVVLAIPDEYGYIYNYNEDGSEFILFSGNYVTFWDTESLCRITQAQIPAGENFANVDNQFNYIVSDIHYGTANLRNRQGKTIEHFEEYQQIDFSGNSSEDEQSSHYVINNWQQVTFNHNYALLAVISKNYSTNFLKIFDLSNGRILREISLPHRIDSISFSDDDTKIYTYGEGIVYVWGVREE